MVRNSVGAGRVAQALCFIFNTRLQMADSGNPQSKLFHSLFQLSSGQTSHSSNFVKTLSSCRKWGSLGAL